MDQRPNFRTSCGNLLFNNSAAADKVAQRVATERRSGLKYVTPDGTVVRQRAIDAVRKLGGDAKDEVMISADQNKSYIMVIPVCFQDFL